MNCPVHGENVPLEIHHKTPLSKGGKDISENREVRCKRCHREEHRADPDMHRPGWEGLVRSLVSQHMSELGKSGNRKRWGSAPTY